MAIHDCTRLSLIQEDKASAMTSHVAADLHESLCATPRFGLTKRKRHLQALGVSRTRDADRTPPVQEGGVLTEHKEYENA